MLKGLRVAGTINLYVFTSNAHNWSDGEYYFIANGKLAAEHMAIAYQRNYNNRLYEADKHALKGRPSTSMCLQFNLRDIRTFELGIRPGYAGFLKCEKEVL